jgi:hypothetical protein
LAVAAISCAEIRSNTTVSLIPKKDSASRVIGPSTGEVVRRGMHASWRQELDVLRVELVELRECEQLLHEPVVRVERTVRRAGMGLYWEYGLGAVLTSLGIAGLIRPEGLSNSHVNEEGDIEKDLASGYRLAGIALGIGVISLTAGVIDSVRARDEVQYADAYRLQRGAPVACAQERAALRGHEVTLIVGDYRDEQTTDLDGRARFMLPPEPEGTTATPKTHRGVLAFERGRALSVDFVAPYASTLDTPHEGEMMLAPE